MSAPAKDDEVYQQFLATPEYKVAEIIQGRVDTHQGAAEVRAEPFDALELDLSVLWAG